MIVREERDYTLIEINEVVVRRHIVKVKLNCTKKQLLGALEHVPHDAVVSMVIQDDEVEEGEFYGEIVYEERVIK